MRVQKTIANSDTALSIALPRRIANDLDYLAACLHARRSRMAEAERLDGLCRIRNLTEFIQTILPDSGLKEVLDFQRLLVYELIDEISGFSTYVPGSGAYLLDWTLVRYQMENLKVLFRACLAKVPIEEAYRYLVPLPKELVLNSRELAAAESPEEFVRLIPKGFIRENIERAFKIHSDYLRPFFFEAVLDRIYFQGLIAGTEKLSQEDREIIKPMVCQEVDIFHLMLVIRGKFYYGITPEILQTLHVEGTQIRQTLFAAMLNDSDFHTAIDRVAENVLNIPHLKHGSSDGSIAVDAPIFESLAWNQFFRLSNTTFRRSHMGLGAIMGYAGLRRVEVANLITISEGIRIGMTAETIRGRLIPRNNMEGAYV